MGYYRSEPVEKAYNVFTEKADQVCVADIELIPNEIFTRDNVYKIQGVGSMFEGTYRFKKVIHLINTSGYTSHAEARMVYDKRGNFIEGGYTATANNNTPAKDPAPVTTRNDMQYTVKSGDTLSAIARTYCHSTNDWRAIEAANHAMLVARNSRNASDLGHWIYPGMVITIPNSLLK
jgi:nucleoid-associated protein YgaU